MPQFHLISFPLFTSLLLLLLLLLLLWPLPPDGLCFLTILVASNLYRWHPGASWSILKHPEASWSIVEHRGAANIPEIDQGKRKSDNYQSETELGWGRVGGKVGGREEEQEEEEQEEEIVQECSRVECLTAQLHGVPNKGKRKRDNDE